MHLEDDDLVLHYYGELAGAQEDQVVGHLAQCGECHGSYRRLQRVLITAGEHALSGPDPAGDFERTVWARLAPSLSAEPRGRRAWWARLPIAPAHLGWAAATLALALGAFMAGRLSPVSVDSGAVATASQVRDRILLVDLSDHLDQSQRVLVELVTADVAHPLDISAERDRAVQLVSANRLYRETAEATGDTSIVALLDQLERVLIDLAASSAQLSAREIDDVRERIESGSLLFKVQVVSSDLEERRRAAAQRIERRSAL